MPKLTQKELKDALHYDPDTGCFTWRKRASGRVMGIPAGGLCKTLGYIAIRVNYKRHYAHRLAFLYMNGEFPVSCVDHINMDRSDNRWKNLRPATRAENMMNKGAMSNNKSGYKGVSITKEGGFLAQIGLNGKVIYIGTFPTAEIAHDAYILKSKELHGEFSRNA